MMVLLEPILNFGSKTEIVCWQKLPVPDISVEYGLHIPSTKKMDFLS